MQFMGTPLKKLTIADYGMITASGLAGGIIGAFFGVTTPGDMAFTVATFSTLYSLGLRMFTHPVQFWMLAMPMLMVASTIASTFYA